MTNSTTNKYAKFLLESGVKVIEVDGIVWQEYSGFFMPAYLSHCVPAITEETAKKVLSMSGKPFVRWDSNFGEVDKGQWWYVVKRGKWDIAEVSHKKKRWAVRQGIKNFNTRHMEYEEVLEKCPRVAKAASERYIGKAQVEDKEMLSKRIKAGRVVPNVLEYYGCFKDDRLVSYAESYVQGNGVWWAVIRHDPAYLNNYSSYGLIAGMLEYYLNERKMDYVFDGSRSIHHRTEFQDHLMRVYNFERCYARLHLIYKPSFRFVVKTIFPFRKVIWSLSGRWITPLLDNISAVLKQELIRRNC